MERKFIKVKPIFAKPGLAVRNVGRRMPGRMAVGYGVGDPSCTQDSRRRAAGSVRARRR